ncbi:hypothetical protein BGLA2_610050 [Burkholderia gladioli]|nr:hypothetical protein BGLA2_610050 [Burkholderia gladioli]
MLDFSEMVGPRRSSIASRSSPQTINAPSCPSRDTRYSCSKVLSANVSAASSYSATSALSPSVTANQGKPGISVTYSPTREAPNASVARLWSDANRSALVCCAFIWSSARLLVGFVGCVERTGYRGDPYAKVIGKGSHRAPVLRVVGTDRCVVHRRLAALVLALALGDSYATGLHLTPVPVVGLALGGHECKKRLSDGLLQRLSLMAVKHHTVERAFDADAHLHHALHRLVQLVVAPRDAVEPSDDQHAPLSQVAFNVLPLSPLCWRDVITAHPFVYEYIFPSDALRGCVRVLARRGLPVER